MTARDDAAEAMRDYHAAAGWYFADGFFEDSLDVVPTDVLVRLATERGALVEIVMDRDDNEGGWYTYDDPPFYQAVDAGQRPAG